MHVGTLRRRAWIGSIRGWHSLGGGLALTLSTLVATVGCGDAGADGSGPSGGTTSGPAATSTSGGSEADASGGSTVGGSTTDGADDSEGDDEPDRPTYYVSLRGDDGNPGTQQQPWRTLQHAADTIVPGDRVLVTNGDYDELVVFELGGESDARKSFEAENDQGARYRGFIVRGGYIDIEGFEVEADLETQHGVFVDAAAHVSIKGCYVHDCPLGGIDVSGVSLDALASDVELIGNRVHHNGQWGIHVVGSRVLVEGNEISDSVQHHPKGEPDDFSGQDADGMRIFGDHHTIRGNFIHGIADPADAEHNIDPHADCIQTWDRQDQGGRPVMTDTVIERNHCIIQHPSGKGVIMSAIYDNPCHDITIRNNIFEFRDEGIEASEGLFADIFVYNNVFKANLDDPPWGVSIHLADDTANFDVRNNIMVDCHAQVRSIGGTDGTVDHNLVWYSSGAPPAGVPGAQANELWGVDPMFVGYDGGVGGDFHLRPGSPAIDAGAPLDGVSDDYDGNPRPQGGSHDMGAYEQ